MTNVADFHAGSLENFHLAFDPHKLQLLRRSVTVIEEKFFSRLDDALGEDSDPMVAVHHDDFGVAVGVDRVIGEADFVAFAGRVDDEVVVEVEEEAAGVFVVDFAAPIGLVLRNYFTAIFLK